MSPTVRLRPNVPGAALAKTLICEFQGRTVSDALGMAEQECKSTPEVAEHFRRKTAVGAGAIATSHNLDDVAPVGPGAEAFNLLQSRSIFGRLSTRCRRVPFRTKFPKEVLAGVAGAWRGEGLPRPLVKSSLDTLTQDRYEAGVLLAATREVMRFGRTSETFLVNMVINGTDKYTAQQLLDPSVSLSANVHPASITNGAPVVTTAGTTAANVITDLTALLEAIATPGDSLVWIMRPITYYAILAKLAGVGLTQAPGQLLGIPVILGSTSPQQITLVDCDSIAVSYDETMDVSISREASIEMVDGGSSQSGLTGTGVQMVSLFQSGLVGIKAELVCAWQPIQDMAASPVQAAGVAYCVVTY